MTTTIQRINNLDVSLFNAIPSTTSDDDKQSLLAVQRATAINKGDFVYLEIGSYMGGTIQPFLLDQRCKKIYSIDSRPNIVPDDRSKNYMPTYKNNSSERMLKLLGEINASEISKIECFETDTKGIEPSEINLKPNAIFIDGEHTKNAVLSDFHFLSKIFSKDCTILFHDLYIIYPAISQICKNLKKQKRKFKAFKFDGGIFAIFLDKELILQDKFINNVYSRNKNIFYLI